MKRVSVCSGCCRSARLNIDREFDLGLVVYRVEDWYFELWLIVDDFSVIPLVMFIVVSMMSCFLRRCKVDWMMLRKKLFSGFKTRLRGRQSEATTTKQLMEKREGCLFAFSE
jgi:hypothetical protein